MSGLIFKVLNYDSGVFDMSISNECGSINVAGECNIDEHT